MKDIICVIGEHIDSSVTFVKWLKDIGDPVTANEPICEVATDKATIEIAAPADGIFCMADIAPNQQVKIGSVIGKINDSSLSSKIEVLNVPSESTHPVPQPRLTPGARRLLKERGISVAELSKIESRNIITTEDLSNLNPGRIPISSYRVPHSAMRRTIAKRVKHSVNEEAPHVTAFFEADFKNLLNLIANRKNALNDNTSPSLSACIIKAASLAIFDVPEINSRWTENELEIFQEHHIGVVTSLERHGLLLPVIRNVELKSAEEISLELQEIKRLKNEGRLKPPANEVGTFSISNYGSQAGLSAAPIVINQPQSAILGVGRIEYRLRPSRQVAGVPKLEDFEVRPMAYVSLTIDHRVLDAFHANSFMNKFTQIIESPAMILE